jgi:uncharacterized Zn-binding protein involved in type VI secretion
MPPGPAARKNDLTLPIHGSPKIVTGSPDTTIKGQPAARLWDITDVCKLPPTPLVAPCKPPMGRIVSASMTVFINKVGAARLFDLVYCGALAVPHVPNPVPLGIPMIGQPNGGTPPSVSEYRPRREDHYEKLMEVEHERSQFDDVDPQDRQAYDGQRQAPTIPVGVPPAAVKPRKPPPPTPRPGSKPAARKSTDKPNPVGKKKAAGAPPKKKSISLPSVPLTGKPAVGQGVAGSALGPPTRRGPPQKPPEEKERQRRESQVVLRFPINLRFGFKRGLTVPLPAPNSVFFPSVDWKTLIGG